MIFGRIAKIVLLVAAVGAVAVVTHWLTGWRPRFGLEAEFQRVINEANIVDHYRGGENGGWDKADVTNQICGKVNREILNGLGIPADERTSWPFAINGSTDKPQDIWSIVQDEGLIGACSSFSSRKLKIDIHRSTQACEATVTAFPTCDL